MEFIALAVAALLVGADQLTKHLIASDFMLHETRPVVVGVLNFTYVHNRGAAFGILENHRWVFLSITTVVILAGIFLLVTRRIRSKWLIWAAAFVIAGGAGNMIDRIFRSYVIDFIDVQFVKFYVFNVADACVVTGALMMMAYFVFETLREHGAKLKAARAQPEPGENHEEG